MSEKNNSTSGRLLPLFYAQFYDLNRRLEIIASEINHFISSVNYLYSNQEGQEEYTSNDIFKKLISAGITLEADINNDRHEYKEFKEWWDSVFEGDEKDIKKQTYYYYFAIPWQAKMLVKSSVFAERLGELQNRLNMLLQRINSDFPKISIRRRKEQGQMDKYLSVHAEDVHKNLVNEISNHSKRVPHCLKNVTNVFGFCRYDNSSSQHAFLGEELYKKKKKLTDTDDTNNTNEGIGEKSQIVNIGFSYWLTERLALQPVIGHELGHQIIEDIYGRGRPHTKLSKPSDKLDRVLHRATNCIDSWLGEVDKNYNWYLVREVVCDLLGASSYGYAFLYAWIMEFRDFTELASLFHDDDKMIRSYRDFFKNKKIDIPHIQRNFVNMASGENSKLDVIFSYYRGIVLLDFLDNVFDEKSYYEKELHEQVKAWLDLFLDFICGIDGDFNTHVAILNKEREKAFARDFSNKILGKKRKFSYYYKFSKKILPHLDENIFISMGKKLLTPKSPDIGQLYNRYFFDKNDSLIKESLRRKFKNEKDIENKIDEEKKNILEKNRLKITTIHDASWKSYWEITRTNNKGKKIIKESLNKARLLTFISIEKFLSSKYLTKQEKNQKLKYDALYHKLLAQEPEPSDDKYQCPQTLELLLINSNIEYINGENKDTKNNINKELGHNESDEFITLMGRFDELAIRENVKPANFVRKKIKEINECKYIYRSKSIVPLFDHTIGSFLDKVTQEKLLASVFISLKNDYSREYYANLINEKFKTKLDSIELDYSICLSDGWGDLIIFLTLDETKIEEGYKNFYNEFIFYMDFLNNDSQLPKNELLANGILHTETVFSKRALKFMNSSNFNLKFLCTVQNSSIAKVRKSLEELKLNEKYKDSKLHIFNMYGQKDFLIYTESSSDSENKYKQLHDELLKIGKEEEFRVETQVFVNIEEIKDKSDQNPGDRSKFCVREFVTSQLYNLVVLRSK